MLFKSTRSKEEVSSTVALINGIANDGGLYIPTSFPTIDLQKNCSLKYKELANTILSNFLDLDPDFLKESIEKAYDNFDCKNVAPVAMFEGYGYIELFHGKTVAFKDIALSILPYLISGATKMENIDKKIMILTATSGDTGSAAIMGFKNVDNMKICVLYPKKGISQTQRLQMTTVDAKNVQVYGIDGNFDDAQRTVKSLFANDEIKKKSLESGYLISSANSINIGRLLPQIVYYFSSYFSLVEKNKIKIGDQINVVVPTGNFGNIMASYIAKNMGLPIEHFVCASNENNILTDFLNTGIYDTNREFFITSSPSMDILISSNLERLIYFICGEEATKKSMDSLKNTGKFSLDKNLFSEFFADFASDEEVELEINNTYDFEDYLIDPHTAVGTVVYKKFLDKTNSPNYTLIAATASPYKFPKTIAEALEIEPMEDEFELISEIEKLTKVKAPKIIDIIKNSKEIFKEVIQISKVDEKVVDFVKKNI